jgi:hypothetical protein
MRTNHPAAGPTVLDRAWQADDLPRLLADAAISPACPEVGLLLRDLEARSLPGRTLVHAIVACQRLSSWLDAAQQEFLAALCRPGVAVPVDRVIEAARWSNAKPGELCAPDSAVDAVIDSGADPASDPECAPAIAHHAARFASMEVGAALHLSPLAASIKVQRALTLVDRMPGTLAALRTGKIDSGRATILAEGTALLSPEVRAAVESHVLGDAGSRTASQLRATLTRTILRLDPDGSAERAKAARKRRDAYSRPETEDLATVCALMAADKAATMMWLLNTMADTAAGPGDIRTIGERRIDALTDIIDDLVTTGVADIRRTAAPTSSSAETEPARCDRYRPTSLTPTRPPVSLTVYIAASTLAGCDDWPAQLAGQGAITPGLARELARAATRARVVVVGSGPPPQAAWPGPAAGMPARLGPRSRGCAHPGCSDDPTCGGDLDHGHDIYRPPDAVVDQVIDRDRVCRFPGCRMPAARCDLDHTVAFDAGGSTCPCNLRPLCRAHHRAKTFTGWTYTTTPDGAAAWTSPLGLRYTDPPEDSTLRLVLDAPSRRVEDDDEPPY